MKKIYDAIIIGGGPAGVSASLYAARGGLDVCILHTGMSALHKAKRIENYYGPGAVSGKALYDSGIVHAKSLGVEVIEAQATSVSGGADNFTVTSTAGELTSRRLVIATGAARKTADIPGVREYEGRGVSYCAVCDAFFVRGKRAAVLGSGEFAEHECGVLSSVCSEVLLLTDGAKAAAVPSGVRVITEKIARADGNGGRLDKVIFESGAALNVSALFVALGVMSAADIAKSMGVITDKSGAIATDARGMTNIEGLYAAGDCTAGIRQVGKAVSDGITVGMSLIKELKKAGAPRE